MVSFEHQLKKSESILRQSRKAYEKRSSSQCFELPKGKTVNIPLPRKSPQRASTCARRVDMFYGDIKFLL